jgi:hypothetical protein
VGAPFSDRPSAPRSVFRVSFTHLGFEHIAGNGDEQLRTQCIVADGVDRDDRAQRPQRGQSRFDRLTLAAHLVALLLLGSAVGPGEEFVEQFHRLVDVLRSLCRRKQTRARRGGRTAFPRLPFPNDHPFHHKSRTSRPPASMIRVGCHRFVDKRSGGGPEFRQQKSRTSRAPASMIRVSCRRFAGKGSRKWSEFRL